MVKTYDIYIYIYNIHTYNFCPLASLSLPAASPLPKTSKSQSVELSHWHDAFLQRISSWAVKHRTIRSHCTKVRLNSESDDPSVTICQSVFFQSPVLKKSTEVCHETVLCWWNNALGLLLVFLLLFLFLQGGRCDRHATACPKLTRKNSSLYPQVSS